MASRVLTPAFAKELNHLLVGNAVVVKGNELESALARPGFALHYQPHSTPADLAATLAYGVIMGHPFMDGNKRTAFWLANQYLAECGASTFGSTPNPSAVNAVMASIGDAHSRVAMGSLDVEGLAQVYRSVLGN
jgi:prophage maintenance system killer protein